RLAGYCREYTADLPPAGDPLRRTAGPILLALAERQLVYKCHLKVLRNIKTGQRAIALQIGKIVERNLGPAVVIGRVDHLRPGVSAFQNQAIRDFAIDRYLQRMVVGTEVSIPRPCDGRTAE